MKLSQLLAAGHAAMEAHGDMDVIMEVEGDRPGTQVERDAAGTDCFQCLHVNGHPWFFSIQDPEARERRLDQGEPGNP